MTSNSSLIVRNALTLAVASNAEAVLMPANAVESDRDLYQMVCDSSSRIILIRHLLDSPSVLDFPQVDSIMVPDVHLSRTDQIKVALLICLAKGLLHRGDRLVCLIGIEGSNVIDTCMLLNLNTEHELFSTVDALNLGSDVAPEVFERTLSLATQLSFQGREGRRVGAIFVVGDSHNVLSQSRLLVLNPFHGYPESVRNILDPNVEDTVKEFAAIDGAFIVRGDGIVLTAGSQLLSNTKPPQLAKGLGTRHSAAAAITASTGAIAIVVSQSTGTVTVFKNGQMVTDLHNPSNNGEWTI